MQLQTSAKDQLRALVARIERLEEEKAALAADLREVYAEAKGSGFDVKALRTVIRLRKLGFEVRSDIRFGESGEMEPALEALRAARATTVQLLAFMSEQDWQRQGTHTESGLYTPEHWLKIYAAHAHNHAAQIRRLKDTLNT